jgi:putative membrane protein
VTDSQIVSIVSTANSGEIELGNLAVQKASVAPVLAFAQMMITMHTAAQARQASLLPTLNLTPEDNMVSMRLREEAMSVAARLQPLTATSFDVAYIESQVAIHTEVLGLFDDVLLPSVTAPALRADLVLARGEVAAHLAEARLLLAALQGGPDGGMDDGGN